MQASLNRGYIVLVINDVILAVSDSIKTNVLKEYRDMNIDVINSAEFFSAMKQDSVDSVKKRIFTLFIIATSYLLASCIFI